MYLAYVAGLPTLALYLFGVSFRSHIIVDSPGITLKSTMKPGKLQQRDHLMGVTTLNLKTQVVNHKGNQVFPCGLLLDIKRKKITTILITITTN